MIRRYLVLMVASACVCVACPGPRPVTPMPPKVTDQSWCGAACTNLRKLGCGEGQPIDMKRTCSVAADCAKGNDCSGGKCFASCEQFCVDTEDAGVWLMPTCIASITSCSQIESCPAPRASK